MMQVSTLYAHSIERQLVSRRNLIQKLSTSCIEKPETMVLSDSTNPQPCRPDNQPVEVDPKEFTDRLCKLPSQCRGGYILGSPRRHSLSHSMNNLLPGAPSLMKSHHMKKMEKEATMENDKKGSKKDKEKAKKLPSNFMHLGSWTTRHNCEKLLEKVQTGDVLEFNIKLHHHWGIAMVPKCKKLTLANVEIVHLFHDKDVQRSIKQSLGDYWPPGVTARINNSRDVHKPPHSSTEVAATALKLVSQSNRIWENSEQMINHCRYGETARTRQLSDAARWGALNKVVGRWFSMTSSNRSSPSSSPSSRRKRTGSVSF